MEMKALLLCEESESIYVLSDVLGELEVSLELCHDRDQALDRLLNQRFEAVIVDCQVADAIDMLRYVRLTGDNKNTVSLALVGNLGAMQEALDNGANFVLCKPLSPEPVARTIRAMKGLIFRMGRRSIRVQVQTLAFVELDSHAEQAIILDLSEGGMAIQALAPVEASKVLQIRFDLPGTKKRLQLAGEIAWADASGRAGIRFVDVPQQCLEALKEWIFVNSVAPSRIAMPTRNRAKQAEERRDFAASIEVAPSTRVGGDHPALLSLSAENTAERIFGTCVDGAIVLAATVLFGALVFEFSSTMPQSKLALPIGLLVPGLFWLAYHSIFLVDPNGTPGAQVARLGNREAIEQPLTRRERLGRAVALLLAALRLRLGEVHDCVQETAPSVVGERVSMGPITISPIR
ncbi:MAG TPA: PilZ domain-containing protein [Terriglobales bacterium]|nr:PilZ domain-containing protein [Terriglobales bacterium]